MYHVKLTVNLSSLVLCFPTGCGIPYTSCPPDQYVIPGSNITLKWEYSIDGGDLDKISLHSLDENYTATSLFRLGGSSKNITPPYITFTEPATFTVSNVSPQNNWEYIGFDLLVSGTRLRDWVPINFCEVEGEQLGGEAECSDAESVITAFHLKNQAVWIYTPIMICQILVLFLQNATENLIQLPQNTQSNLSNFVDYGLVPQACYGLLYLLAMDHQYITMTL